ncbi:MAG: 50S ribosomal protein L11 methyltransferase [Gammaproteobacteria bacterium]|jgi:ribosomal protein L11 methyltransferase|nr:50S ribosomal protein L11 methyltransferase [Gammaproteobacteria bacterium]
MVSWCQFAMNLGALNIEAVEEIFERFGASSVTLTDADDNPVLEPGPGETPLWTNTTVTGMFSPDIDLQALKVALISELHLSELPAHQTEMLEDRTWEREWLKDFSPMQFGKRLWIYPTGYDAPGGGEIIIHLDPGLAFGTGTHATTALCLEWLDCLSLDGKTMLDYGCGSGVLAIAALKLGCSSATGVDIDPQALIATQQNASDNEVSENLNVLGAAIDITSEFDVVIANILAGPLIQFAESITRTLGELGMLALSGILYEQADDVMTAFEPWIEFDPPVFREQDGQIWSRLTGKRRAD